MKRSSLGHTSAPIPYVVGPSADSNTRYVFPTICVTTRHRLLVSMVFSIVITSYAVTSLVRSSFNLNTYISFFRRRLATFAHILEKSHSVARSPHAKSASPAQTNSPAMRGYTVTTTVQRPRVGPAKKIRCLCPLQMVGMRRTSLSPRELLKRRPGAEQTVMMRCVYVESSLSFLPNALHLTRRSPTPAQYIIPRGVPVHPFHCQPMHPLLPSPLCRA